jgi:uncharacterized protein YciI
MKRIILPKRGALLTSLIFLLAVGTYAQESNASYDKTLADSLGSDEYGMKRYVLVILKTGTAQADQSTTDSLFRGHMQNIGRLASAGKLVVAGPMRKNERDYRGIFILNTASIEEAKSLLDTDPAIKAKLLDAELYGWYGSAALPMYLPFHKKLEKKKI